jgi:hypothetical protein
MSATSVLGGNAMSDEAGASRPKIHRIPKKKIKPGELYVSRSVLILCVALLLAVIAPALWSHYRSAGKSVAKIVDSPAQAGAMTDEQGSIAVRDENGKLVGQLTKMPADTDNSVINTTARIDPKTGKELMNIISKY